MWLWIVEGLLAWLVVSAVAGVVIGQVIRRADAEQRRIDRAVLGEVVPASDLERAVCGRLRHGQPPRRRNSSGGERVADMARRSSLTGHALPRRYRTDRERKPMRGGQVR